MRKVNNFLLWFIAGTSVFILLFSGITISPMQAKGKPQPVSPPLTLAASNIVTYEGAKDRLRAWGNNGDEAGYSNIWTAEDVHYSSIAIGDIDGDIDGQKEIVGVAYCKQYIGKGKKRSEYQYKIFINAYKENEAGIWKTTYYDDENNIIEEPSWLNFEIVLNDIEGDGINEIILVTRTYLAVYKYDSAMLKKIASRQLSKDIPEEDFSDGQYSLRLQSVTVGDIDGDDQKEIIAAGHLISIHKKGYIFIYNLDANSESGLVKKQFIPVDYNFGDHSLRAGDFDGDGLMELCATAFENDDSYPNDTYEPYILLWDYDSVQQDYILHYYYIPTNDTSYPWNHLDVGNLDNDPSRDEIALVVGNSKQLWIYNWSDSQDFTALPTPKTIELDPLTAINDIAIGNSNNDDHNEINISGAIKVGKRWKFYLAVYAPYEESNPIWEMKDTNGTEVFCIAVDKKL